MADLKISQLPAATTPIAGTEVLPIVQSSATKKIASDDLTVKNLRSNATSGILQVAGPAAAATRIMTVPDANFTAARTDDANSFTGDQTLSTGNLIIGTSGKGIDFSATGQATGMTSELFADYEEGTFTPEASRATSAPTLTYTSRAGRYTKTGRIVTVTINMVLNTVTSAGSGATIITGLPFACVEPYYSGLAIVGFNDALVNTVYAAWVDTTTVYFRSGTRSASNDAGGWSAGGYLMLTLIYQA